MLKTIIADDEPLARARIQRLLSQDETINIVAVVENGMQVTEEVDKHQPDLLILDINMPGKTGMEVAHDIQQSMLRPPAIVFTTAYDEFALEAFQVSATAYLMKPINELDLMQAIKKAGELNKVQAQDISAGQPVSSNLLLKSSAEIEMVSVKDIIFFQAREKLVIAGMAKGKEIVVDYSLKELEQKLQSAFCRVHRHTLVNVSFFKKIHRNEKGYYSLELHDVESLFDISRRQVATVKRHFQETI